MKCKECSLKNCKKCSNIEENNCLQCNEGYYLNNNECKLQIKFQSEIYAISKKTYYNLKRIMFL